MGLPASRAFYLAFFAFSSTSLAQVHGSGQSNTACAIEPGAIVSDACASYQTLDDLSHSLYPKLNDVTQNSDFFSYYRLNLYNRQCPYWDDSLAACGNIACAVSTIDSENDIPEIWRMSELSKLRGPKAEHPNKAKQKERGTERPLQGGLGEDVDESCVVEYDDECDERDYCIPEDAGSPGKGDYVSLVENPERFTGYAGEHAHMVWDAIYRENCFTMPRDATSENPFAPGVKNEIKTALLASNKAPTFLPDDSCLEKRVFHRVISGMHASISTHICHEYLNQSTGVWAPNLQCYKERLHAHPDRISNLYFNFALVTRAVAKLAPYLESYTFCSGDPIQDKATKRKVLDLARTAANGPSIFDESLMFKDPANWELKEDFRTRFRNVSRIMDCVGCDKCRLWGKVQTHGYGTALKVLFEFNGEDAPEKGSLPLQRTELVALVNTMARLGNSMNALTEFRGLLDTEDVASQGPSASASAPAKAEGQNPAEAVTGGYVTHSGLKNDSKPSSADQEAEEDLYEDLPEEDGWDAALVELKMVFYTIVFIFKEWAALPSRLWLLALYQLDRFWSWYLGFYVEPPLEWRLNRIPFTRDEL